MSTTFKCFHEGCAHETSSEFGFKSHLSKTHKGYTPDDLRKVGITPNERDIARSLAGNESARDVSSSAPESEPSRTESGTRKTRKKSSDVDPEIQKAQDAILRARCERIAALPYTLLGAMLKDESLKLEMTERAMLTESYFMLAKAYGWEGASKLILWGDVMICNAAIIARRKDAIFEHMGITGEPTLQPEPEPKPATTVQ